MINDITFFDLETTGTDKVNGRIVQLAFAKGKKRFQSLVNPGCPIPEGASAVHKITDETVKDAPTLKELIPKIKPFIEGSHIGGFNSNSFDVPFLYNELYRNGYVWDLSMVHLVDAFVIFSKMERRNLEGATKFYCKEQHVDAHDAMADVEATIKVFQAQLKMYGLGDTPQDVELFCNNGKPRCDISGCFYIDDDGDYRFNFGKHKDRKCKDNKDYLSWMVGDSASFIPDTKQIAFNIIKS